VPIDGVLDVGRVRLVPGGSTTCDCR
jgi:hypothetical protein